MSLKEKIDADLKKAAKERKVIEVSVLRLLKDAIFLKEKEKRYKIFNQRKGVSEKELEKESQLSDEEIIEVIFAEIKKRKEAILEFEKGKRKDLVEKEKKEIEILKKYLPEQLSEKEVEKIVKEAIKKLGAKDIKDMGRVMKELMPKLKGRVEGSLISKIVKDLLEKK
jgi:uncharacterized protein YqeY